MVIRKILLFRFQRLAAKPSVLSQILQIIFVYGLSNYSLNFAKNRPSGFSDVILNQKKLLNRLAYNILDPNSVIGEYTIQCDIFKSNGIIIEGIFFGIGRVTTSLVIYVFLHVLFPIYNPCRGL